MIKLKSLIKEESLTEGKIESDMDIIAKKLGIKWNKSIIVKDTNDFTDLKLYGPKTPVKFNSWVVYGISPDLTQYLPKIIKKLKSKYKLVKDNQDKNGFRSSRDTFWKNGGSKTEFAFSYATGAPSYIHYIGINGK